MLCRLKSIITQIMEFNFLNKIKRSFYNIGGIFLEMKTTLNAFPTRNLKVKHNIFKRLFYNFLKSYKKPNSKGLNAF